MPTSQLADSASLSGKSPSAEDIIGRRNLDDHVKATYDKRSHNQARKRLEAIKASIANNSGGVMLIVVERGGELQRLYLSRVKDGFEFDKTQLYFEGTAGHSFFKKGMECPGRDMHARIGEDGWRFNALTLVDTSQRFESIIFGVSTRIIFGEDNINEFGNRNPAYQDHIKYMISIITADDD